MAMELKGKVVQILPIQSGTSKRGEWRKQEFIVETQGQYSKKACLSIWGNKIDQFDMAEGDDVNVSFELESREYNNRWYTEARAWKVEKTSVSMPSGSPSLTDESFDNGDGASDELPF